MNADELFQPIPRYHGHYADHCRLIINATRMDDVVTRADYNTVRRCLVLLPDDLRLRWIRVMDTLTIVEDGSEIET